MISLERERDYESPVVVVYALSPQQIVCVSPGENEIPGEGPVL